MYYFSRKAQTFREERMRKGKDLNPGGANQPVSNTLFLHISFFLFLVIPEFEIRVMHLLDKHFTT
jgi:hypothetical protein